MTTYPITGCLIPLGIQGEQLTRSFAFDISGWEDCEVMLAYRRPGAEIPYFVDLELSGTTLTWTAAARDVAFPGTGEAVMRFYRDNELRKTTTFSVIVLADPLAEPGDPPEDFDTWFDRLTEIQRRAEAAAARAEAAAGGSGEIIPGASSWSELYDKPFETIGNGLKVVGTELQADTAEAVEQDNTLPISSAAVYVEVGNINALLSAI